MNYLAHIFLSGDDEALLIGNFIADAVKGKQQDLYPEGIARGIKLHRLIDTYTDSHPVVNETKARLRPHFRKYAPVVADLYFDHFLANRFAEFSSEPLEAYTSRIYTLINQNLPNLPERVQYFFPYMMRQNWLVSYAQVSGIAQALGGLSRRTAFESGMERAGEELLQNYALYGQDFTLFFPELIAYVEEVLPELK
ncbi:acyl carrier protein phosphodiesterase [Pontibacter ramchanderi]|uniref:Acyl carrier protein phosphodiesterase n=1 Tax=Pontibacter ramchanderi TaxID=1179743 RepID=A0A2N3V1A2_9BACT|nr:ACP phosphodiesterase [Pontibacter ramchanderi]PKV75408.1 acyl carrier protein phosphodiesterase [Pontibacter ramchanderi]